MAAKKEQPGRRSDNPNVFSDMMGGREEFRSTVLTSVINEIRLIGVRVRYNKFISDMEVDFSKSGIVSRRSDKEDWTRFRERDVLDIHVWLGTHYDRQPKDGLTREAVAYLGYQNELDPARDALQALKWDGVKRLTGCLSYYFGVTGRMAEIYGPKWWVGLCARVWGEDLRGNNSVKNDTALVLVGAQGILKSTAFRVIAESLLPGSFNDSFAIDMETKKVMEQSKHKIILEAADMRLSGRDADEIKQMMSSQADTERMVWRRDPETIARRFVIVGTTNKDSFLHDDTGDRRFWVVRAGEIRIDELRRDCPQLWAEAFVRFKEDKETWWLTAEESRAQEEANLEFIEDEPYFDVLEPKLRDIESGYITLQSLFKLVGKPFELVSMADKKIMAKTARKLGLRRDN